MPDNMTFRTIPSNWRVPGSYLEIDNSRAMAGLPNPTRRILLIGQRLASGTIQKSTLTQITRPTDGATYFGRGSILAGMVAATVKVNPTTECWAIALDDITPAGGFATKVLTVTGTATESGTIAMVVAGVRLTVGVTNTQTAANIATAIAAAINGNGDLPVTATVANAIVTITARMSGEVGNDIDVRWNYYTGESLPAGITLAVVATNVNGGNPSLLDAIAAISNNSFTTIAMAYSDVANMTAMEAELVGRWGGLDMRSGHVFTARYGTAATLQAYGAARNSPHSTVFGLNGCPTPPWIVAAQAAAAAEFSGGNDPAIPFHGLVLPDVLAPLERQRFTNTERNNLLFDGISTIIFDQSGVAAIEQVITTYQTNSSGVEDLSLLKLNTKWTLDYIRQTFKAAIARDYPNAKLAGDDVLDQLQEGQAVATPRLIRDTLIGEAVKLQRIGLIEDMEGFKKGIIVKRSDADPDRVNVILAPNVVNQFEVLAASIQFKI
ncbi:MAG: phage tail sheath C-terminal domain-containing protein [Candidatus Pacebacteria bacterium]|nr:phage tail sheath C-terminal domain-containing protein [Candidatus Paceibacterota bacterium]